MRDHRVQKTCLKKLPSPCDENNGAQKSSPLRSCQNKHWQLIGSTKLAVWNPFASLRRGDAVSEEEEEDDTVMSGNNSPIAGASGGASGTIRDPQSGDGVTEQLGPAPTYKIAKKYRSIQRGLLTRRFKAADEIIVRVKHAEDWASFTLAEQHVILLNDNYKKFEHWAEQCINLAPDSDAQQQDTLALEEGQKASVKTVDALLAVIDKAKEVLADERGKAIAIAVKDATAKAMDAATTAANLARANLPLQAQPAPNQQQGGGINAADLAAALAAVQSVAPKTVHVIQNKLRLPEFTLDKFSGDILKWQDWHASFYNAVEKRPDLEPQDKMNYLTHYLTGNAKSLVDNIAVGDASFSTAMSALKKQYEDHNRVIDAHLRIMRDRPCLPKNPTFEQINRFHNDYTSSLTALRKAGTPLDSAVSLNFIETKLAGLTKLMWEEEKARREQQGDDISISDLNRIVERMKIMCRNQELTEKCKAPVAAAPLGKPVAKSLAVTGGATGAGVSTGGTSAQSSSMQNDTTAAVTDAGSTGTRPKQQQSKKKKKKREKRRDNSNLTDSQPEKCPSCQSTQHQLAECSAFKKLSTDAKWEFVCAHKLCFHCFGAHPLRRCANKQACGIGGCDQPHNKVLHGTTK